MSSGLTVFRLGVQATAHDDLVHGLICLRVRLQAGELLPSESS